jgi:hypothetical protein
MFDGERCGYLGKLRYATRQAAKDELKRFAYRKGSRKVHFCVFCDGYHLTKDARGNRKGKP